MEKVIEIALTDSDFRKITVKNNFVELDSDYLKLVAKVSDLKIVEYLTWHCLECDKWSVAIESSSVDKLLELGVMPVPHTQSPMLNESALTVEEREDEKDLQAKIDNADGLAEMETLWELSSKRIAEIDKLEDKYGYFSDESARAKMPMHIEQKLKNLHEEQSAFEAEHA